MDTIINKLKQKSQQSWKETGYSKKAIKTAIIMTLISLTPILFIVALLIIGLFIKFVPKWITLIIIAGLLVRAIYKKNLKKAAQDELLDAEDN